ncbi:unnamed protein product [Parascedosporium putredinis]|uniref:Nickel/cobalt efflux system n=1 Tax=Parascedosporium putredinis TaxID=1442378 RepID=A0A9P1M8W5_9PEZI|nr:unnamed protein product [Parascedosporium putredinis]CAI7989663.1 unnamed protein product [Parascedosporium putredinis]
MGRRSYCPSPNAILAWSLGLRHAFDADHISAIDLMTRRLLATGQKAVTVGTFFSLGHSTIVIITSIVVAATAAAISTRFDNFSTVGGIIGTSVSAAFLILLGLMNAYILYKLIKQLIKVLRLPEGQEDEIWKIEGGGILFNILKKMFKLIDSNHRDPIAFLYYSIVLTCLTVMVAIVIGVIQVLSLVLNVASPTGKFWDGVETAGEYYDVIGGGIAGCFVLVAILSVFAYKPWKRWITRRYGKGIVLQDAQSPEPGAAMVSPDDTAISSKEKGVLTSTKTTDQNATSVGRGA